MTRQDDLAAIRDLYDRIADQYDKAQTGRFVRWLIRDARARAAANLHGRVLEVGIGSGASLPFYARDVEIIGIDLSGKMLSHAERRLAGVGLAGRVQVMDAQKLDFPDQHFDAVAFNLVLCTIPDPSRALREAVRVAKPGAPMVFLEHVRSHHAWIGIPQDLFTFICGRAFHDRFNNDAERLIGAAGIDVVSVDRWFLGAMTLIVGRSPLH